MTCPTCDGLGVNVPNDDDPAHIDCDHLGGDCRCIAGAPTCWHCDGDGSLSDDDSSPGALEDDES